MKNIHVVHVVITTVHSGWHSKKVSTNTGFMAHVVSWSLVYCFRERLGTRANYYKNQTNDIWNLSSAQKLVWRQQSLYFRGQVQDGHFLASNTLLAWIIPTWLYALDFLHMQVSKNPHFVVSKSVKHESSTCWICNRPVSSLRLRAHLDLPFTVVTCV